MYPEWRKRRFFELHLAWLVQGPKGYDLLFKINPYSLYATREEALEAARALVEKGRLDQDERVGRNKAPVLLSEEDKARFLLLLERGKALLLWTGTPYWERWRRWRSASSSAPPSPTPRTP